MRSFFHKDFSFQHKYPIKVWSAGVIDDIPYSVSFDGSTLRQINLFTKKISHSFDYHHLNAYSLCFFMSTNIYKFENLFLLIKNQRFIEIYDSSLRHVPQFDYDTGSAVIAVHWHKSSDRLFTCGTNGWLRCFKVTTKHKVTEFVAEWKLLWEIRSTSDWIISLAHDDFTQLLYGAVEDSLYAWDLNTGDFKYRLPQMHNKFKICQVDVDPESSVVITSGLDGYIRTWDIKELECKNLNSFEVAPEGHVSFYMIGRQIVTIGKDRIINFFGISDSTLRCSVAMADPTKRIDLDEVINPPLVVLETRKGNICVTSYKEEIQTALLSFAPEEILSTDSTVSSMDFDYKENSLLCLCSNNFVVASSEKGKSKTIDLDVPNTNNCKRCSVSEVLCFFEHDDILYAGFKNGSIKCIHLRKRECIMLDQVPLDEPITYVTIVHGLFLFNHPICGEVSPIKTPKNSPFIVCYTEKGNLNVWCARCHTHLLTFEVGKNPITCLKVVPDKSLLLISAQKILTIYSINAYNFIPVGEITTSGNQFITSFEITNNLELIAGTSSGEIMILQIEEGESELHFHLKHHLAFESGIFKIYFNQFIEKPVISLKNGTLIALNQTTAKIISKTSHVDAEPLTSVYFKYDRNENKVGAYLAFGSRIHFAPVDTYEEPIVAKKEEEEEKEEEKEVENDDNEDKEEKIIRYFEESQLNISRLMLLVQKEKLKKKKKRAEYIPEMELSRTPQIQEDLPNKRQKSPSQKLTFNEVMAKNRNAVQEALGIFDYSRPSSASSKKSNYSYDPNKFNSENNDYNRQFSEDNNLNLVVTPFFYTDSARVMVPALKKTAENSEVTETADSNSKISNSSSSALQTPKTSRRVSSNLNSSSSFPTRPNNLTITEKSLVYDEGSESGFQAAIDENENVQRTTPDYIPPGGRFVLTKLKKEPVKAPTIIRKIFVGPPQSSRILFNDPSTLNGLNFFDPRGFQSRFGESESSESNATVQSVSSGVTSNNNEEEEEEEPAKSEAVKSESAKPQSEWFFLGKKKKTDLERRRMLKKRRVSITSMMNPSPRPKTSQQVKRRISAGSSNDAPFKPKTLRTPTTTPAIKSTNDQAANVQRPRPNREPLNTRNHQQETAPARPPILITSAHLEQKEKAAPNKPQNLPEEPTSPPAKPEAAAKEAKDDRKREEAKNDAGGGGEKVPEIRSDASGNERASDGTEASESRPQSPKRVQFVMPGKAPKSDENESNSDSIKSPAEAEIEVDLPVIDIKLRHDTQFQRRRRVKNQPIHLQPQESTLASYIKNKIPEHEKFSKPKPVAPPPRTPPRDESEAIKASMMSPHNPKKSISDSDSSSQCSVDRKRGKRKKRSRSNSGAVSEASSTADLSENSLSSQAAADENPDKKPPQTAAPTALSKDEEQARINQERRKRMALEAEKLLYGDSEKVKDEKSDSSLEKVEGAKEVKCYFKQLKNLQKFWEQKMVFPVMPFDCGDPNTARAGEGKTLFDDSIEKVCPVQNFHLFAGSERNGVADLVERYMKVSAFNRGERENMDDMFEDGAGEDDILSDLPSLRRRLSF